MRKRAALPVQAVKIEEEFKGVDFHSIRLEDRFIRTVETLSKQPDKFIRNTSENRAEAKAIYRMPGKDRTRHHTSLTITSSLWRKGFSLRRETGTLNHNLPCIT
jgi:hypothetical protein